MGNDVEYVLRAKDDASAVVSNLLHRFEAIDGALSKISSIGAGGGVFGLVTGSLVATATAAYASGKAMADYVEQLDRMEENTGIASDRLQAMRRIVENNGGSFDEFGTILDRLNRNIADENPLLKQLGITSRDTFTVFTQVAGALGNMSDAASRAKLANELLGKSSSKTIADMQALAAQTDATRAAMAETGGLIGPDAAAQARALDKQLDALNNSWKDLGTTMQTLVVPLVTPIVKFFDAVLSGAANAARAIREDFGGALEDLYRAGDHAAKLTEEQEQRRSHVGRLINGQFVAPSLDQYGIEASASRPRRGDQRDRGNDERSGRPPLFTFGTDTPTAADVYLQKLRGGDFSDLGDTANSLAGNVDRIGKSFENLDKNSKVLVDDITPTEAMFQRMGQAAVYNIDAAVNAVAWGTLQIDSFFKSLMESILRDMEAAALKAGIGFGLSLLSDIPGLGWLDLIGSAVSGSTPKHGGSHHSSMAPSGGNVFNISTLNAKDLIQEIVSPTGQLRQANDRIRDVARAGAL